METQRAQSQRKQTTAPDEERLFNQIINYDISSRSQTFYSTNTMKPKFLRGSGEAGLNFPLLPLSALVNLVFDGINKL